MNRVTRRVARKPHPCGLVGMRSHCRTILPGEVYLEHVISPDHGDIGNVGWWRANECADCARECGRSELLEATS